ncbi:MAG: hypothetical protein KTR18_12445 [Acidiferrobacterales bacterium]|nr:hypothetical protein [Acidiferrobacterales bacterium]
MNLDHSLKSRIASGEQLTGCWASLANNLTAEILSGAGYDATMIDMEHGPVDFVAAIGLMQAVSSTGGRSLIRVSSADIVSIKRTLDIGPDGIMVPDIRSAEQAREVVKNCRYAPAGNRGAAPGYMRANRFAGLQAGHPALTNYPEFMREHFLLMIQIESAQAIDNIEDICQVEGLDMVFVGPADLSASLGNLGDFESARFIDAMNAIEASAKRNDIALGTIPFPGWDAARLYQLGYQFVIGGSDGLLLAKAAADDFENLSASKTR